MMFGSNSRRRVLVVIAALSMLGAAPAGQVEEPDWDAIGEETVALLQEYLRIDTTNPPVRA